MTTIPSSIPKLTYTKHALYERCKDMLGFIAAAPQAFYKIGCKECFVLDNPSHFKAIYVYDDSLDIHLIIDSRDNTVITNYLQRADNKNAKKGRFRMGYNLSK